MTAPMQSRPSVHASWGWFFALGIILMIGGGSAILSPFLVTAIVETVVGIFFMLGGIVILVQVFTTHDGWSARLTYLILGSFNVLAGLALFFRPLEGLLALTFVLIGALLVNGLLRIIVGIMARPETGSGWVILAGVLSVLLSIYLMTLYPEISAVLLGIAAGIALLGEGAGYVRFAYGLKNNISVSP